MELSEEMKEALRILREDKIIANTAAARKANEDLIARMDARDAADTDRWTKLEERSAAPQGLPTPENDPNPTPGVPPAPAPVEVPNQPIVKKRRGIWFGSDDEEEESK